MFDPGDNLEVAMAIYMDKNMDNEAGIRAAVSRCYSSLLTVKHLLQLDTTEAESDDLHMVAIGRVRKANRALGDRLKFLYVHRLKADLADDVAWGRETIADVHGAAKAFNSEVKSALRASGSSPPAP